MTSRVRAVLLGGGGAGALIGTLLLAGTGLALMYVGTFELVAVAGGPKALECGAWLASPHQAKWVALSGCRLELARAAAQHFTTWSGAVDGGPSTVRTLELPIGVAGAEPSEVVRAVAVTKNPVLLKHAAELGQRSEPDAAGYVAGAGSELSHLLTPKTLKGTVAKGDPSGVAVLEQDVVPVSGQSLGSVALGFFLLMAALWPMARRVQLERELDAQHEPPA